MDAFLFDARDSRLELWQHGQIIVASPAYALLDGESYTFGDTAQAAARLQPRKVNTRYWQHLDTEPLRPPLGPARHTADLVHAHVEELVRRTAGDASWLIAVPSSMRREQLSLLLGILKSSPVSAAGLVSRSVALASRFSDAEVTLHLELQLHQAVISELRRRDQLVEQHSVIALPGCGLLQLMDRAADGVARQFIEQCRFDPRRSAATEQQLYDALPRLLQQLTARGEAELEINGFRARLTAATVADASNLLQERLQQHYSPERRLLLDPLVGLLPGLQSRYVDALLLPEDGLFHSVAHHAEALIKPGSELAYITALPSMNRGNAGATSLSVDARAEQATGAEAQHQQPATHLLLGTQAHKLQAPRQPLHRADGGVCDIAASAGCWLEAQGQHWVLRSEQGNLPLLNGQSCNAGAIVRTGDRLSFDAVELRLIEVLA